MKNKLIKNINNDTWIKFKMISLKLNLSMADTLELISDHFLKSYIFDVMKESKNDEKELNHNIKLIKKG